MQMPPNTIDAKTVVETTPVWPYSWGANPVAIESNVSAPIVAIEEFMTCGR